MDIAKTRKVALSIKNMVVEVIDSLFSAKDKYAFYKIYDKLVLNGYFDYYSIAENLAQLLKGRKKVLELCAGTGNLTFRLAEKGFDMVAVDRDLEMQRQFEARNAGENIPFHLADVAEMQLNTAFEAIFEHSGSMQLESFPNGHVFLLYLTVEKLIASLSKVAGHLQKGGLLILSIETLNQFYLEKSGFSYKRFVIQKTETKGKRLHAFLDKETHNSTLMTVENEYMSLHDFQKMLEKQGFNRFELQLEKGFFTAYFHKN